MALRIKSSTRNQIIAKSQGCCWYCGESEWTVTVFPTLDHLRPVCRGGEDDESNLVRACPECNCQKSFMTVEEFRMCIQAELMEIWLSLGLLRPLVPEVKFYGELVDAVPVTAMEPPRLTKENIEQEMAGLTPCMADNRDIKARKRNRRRILRKKLIRLQEQEELDCQQNVLCSAS